MCFILIFKEMHTVEKSSKDIKHTLTTILSVINILLMLVAAANLEVLYMYCAYFLPFSL